MPIQLTDATGTVLTYDIQERPTVIALKHWLVSQNGTYAEHLLDMYRMDDDEADIPLSDDEQIAPDTKLAYLLDYTRNYRSSTPFDCASCIGACKLVYVGSVTSTPQWDTERRFVSGGWPCVGRSTEGGNTPLYPQHGVLSVSSQCTCTHPFTIHSVDFSAIPTRVHMQYGDAVANIAFKGMVENMHMRPNLQTEPAFMDTSACLVIPGTGKTTHAMRMVHGGTFTCDTIDEPITLQTDMSFDPFGCFPVFGTGNDTKQTPYEILIACVHPSGWLRPSIGPWCFAFRESVYGPFVNKEEAAFAWKVALSWYNRAGCFMSHRRYPESHIPFEERLRRATDSDTYRAFEHTLDADLADIDSNPVGRMFVPLSDDAIDVAERVLASVYTRVEHIRLVCDVILDVGSTLVSHPFFASGHHANQLRCDIQEEYIRHTGRVLDMYNPLSMPDPTYDSIRDLQRIYHGFELRVDACVHLPSNLEGLFVSTYTVPSSMQSVVKRWLLYSGEHTSIGEQATIYDASPTTIAALLNGMCPESRERYAELLHESPGPFDGMFYLPVDVRQSIHMFLTMRKVLGRDRTQTWTRRIRNGTPPAEGTLRGDKRMRTV